MYLVTGGAGFIGSHTVEALVGMGARVRVLDDLSTGRAENLAHLQGVDLRVGSILNGADLQAAMLGVTYVIHLAAQVSVPQSFIDPQACDRINSEGTRRVIEAAGVAGVERVVLASSCAVYGPSDDVLDEDAPLAPASPYAASKVHAERHLAAAARRGLVEGVSLRFFNVFGPRQPSGSPYSGVIAAFCSALAVGRPLKIFGNGSQTRDFIPVGTIALGLARACVCGVEEGEALVLNLGRGCSTSLLRLAGLLGYEGPIDFKPSRAGDVPFSCSDSTRAYRILSLPSCDSAELVVALRDTLRWYQRYFTS